MTWDELKFEYKDFFELQNFLGDIERGIFNDDIYSFLEKHCNAILKAKLEKAPKVFSGPEKNLGSVMEEWSLAEFEGDDTHSARLVCIEELWKNITTAIICGSITRKR